MYTSHLYTNHSLFPIYMIVVGLVVFYLTIMAYYFRKSLGLVFSVKSNRKDFASSATYASDDFIPPLIDRPAPLAMTSKTVSHEELEEEGAEYEILDEEQNVLLKEAEKVVEKIQHVVDNIASRPANPEEVFTKIRAIVCQYSLFRNTEYYDAINSFVAVTVHRDCDLELSIDDLEALWQVAA